MINIEGSLCRYIEVQLYIKDTNFSFLKSTKFPVQYETSNAKNLTIVEEVLNLINQFTVKKKFSEIENLYFRVQKAKNFLFYLPE
jgi:hypothetical protein